MSWAGLKESWRLLRATAWIALRRYERAHRLLAGARTDLAIELLHHGHALRKAGRTEEALEAYGKALRSDPDSGDVRLGVLEALLSLGWDRDRTNAFMDAADGRSPEGSTDPPAHS